MNLKESLLENKRNLVILILSILIALGVFAVLKGVIDVGLKVPYDKRILPSEERIRGEHIASYAKKLLEEDQERYRRMFSRYLSKGLKPEQLPDYFENARNNILNAEEG